MSDISDDYSIITGISGKQYKISRTPPFKPYESDKEWSLKGKKKAILVDWIKQKTKVIKSDDEDGFYEDSDIEILRKKLIEDFFDPKNPVGSLLYWVAQCISFSKEDREEFSDKLYKDISKLINKRFGVEE